MRTVNRKRNAKLNMLTGLLQEIVALICGLILPRFVLSFFGSAYNGILNSITQFLSFSIVLRSGLGSVGHVALYKPLADGDDEAISGVMVATDKFMKKVSLILIGLILAFSVIYPFIVLDEFDYWFSFSLILIIGTSTFVENMFSIKYKIILQADQKYYIQTLAAIIAQILSTGVSVGIMLLGGNIHLVKIGATLSFLSTPLFLNFYVKKHYNINWKVPANNLALKQRWDAFAHQLATIVNNNVDVIILTLMCSMLEVSVYTVYFMVVKNMSQLVINSIAGIKPIFGDMMVREETDNLKNTFKNIESALFAGSTILFATTAILLTPFVLLYTQGVTDVDYNRALFGYAMVAVHLMNVVRVPYQSVVEAAGHFKQTRNGAILEVVCNIVCSVVFVYFFGIIGVILGTFVAAIIRTTQFAWYSNKKILNLSIWRVIKNYAVYFATMALLIIFVPKIIPLNCANYLEWIWKAVLVFVIVTVVVFIVLIIFNRKQFAGVIKIIKNKIFAKKKREKN